MEAPVAGTDQVAGLHEGRVRLQHVESRRTHDIRHEHCPVVYEGTFHKQLIWHFEKNQLS